MPLTGHLRFDLIQNINNEFPDIDGEVILYRGLAPIDPGPYAYSDCDEFGNAEWLPTWEMAFQPANEETEYAWAGKVETKGRKVFIVKSEKTLEKGRGIYDTEDDKI